MWGELASHIRSSTHHSKFSHPVLVRQLKVSYFRISLLSKLLHVNVYSLYMYVYIICYVLYIHVHVHVYTRTASFSPFSTYLYCYAHFSLWHM